MWDLTLKMLGTADSPNFSGKGSETHSLLPWVLEVFQCNIDQFNASKPNIAVEGQLLYAAAKAATAFDNMLKVDTRRFSEDTVTQLMRNYLHFASLFERAGGCLVQKHHLMLHCVQNSRTHGNPRMYTTYRSESFNGVLARIARACHRKNWYRDILFHVSILNAMQLSQMMH